MRAKVSGDIKMQLVVGGDQRVATQQCAAATVGIGIRSPNFVPYTAGGGVAELRKRNRNISCRPPEVRIEDVCRKSHNLLNERFDCTTKASITQWFQANGADVAA